MINFLNLLRSIKDYIKQYENIHKSFLIPKNEIQFKKNSIDIKKLKNEISYNEELFIRLRKNFLEQIYDSGGHWDDIYKSYNIQNLIKELLQKNNDFFYNIISKPHTNNIQHGFSEITKSLISSHRYTNFYEKKTIHDCIFRIACGLGAVKLPEVYHKNNNANFSSDELLDKIFDTIGLKSDFKNTFSMEKGIDTKYGLVSYATIQQLYHALKIFDILKNVQNPKVLEIGAGIGSSAYHAWNFGIKDYSIIDLPLGCITIGFNLSNLIGDSNILLNDEVNKSEKKNNKIKIYNPNNLEKITDQFDLIVNFDSITEMSKKQAEKYVDYASQKCKFFFSINHEGNSFSVNELFKNSKFEKISRNQTWYRQGYIEEFYVNKLIS